MIDTRSAAHALAGDLSGGSVLCPGPGHSSHDRSMSVKFDSQAPDGFLVQSFAGDDWRDCRDHVKDKLGIQPNLKSGQARSRPIVGTGVERPKVDHTAAALKIWNCGELIYGTLAEAYVTRRGLVLPDNINHALRFNPTCPFKGDSVPAMVASMVGIRTNEFCGVHRTRFDPKDKAMLGPAKGAVVKFSPDESVAGGLAICEGIETGLALMAMGFIPLWACLSANGIAKFPVLASINSLTIFADNDASQTGQNAAIECGVRWQAASKEVRIFTTPDTGSDFADGMLL